MSGESLNLHFNFLIYGTPECSYCDKAKALMSNLKIPYVYHDLTSIYDNWKDVFTVLKPVIKNQSKIPIIFINKQNNDGPHPHVDLTSPWTFVGGYYELEAMLEDMDLDLCDNY